VSHTWTVRAVRYATRVTPKSAVFYDYATFGEPDVPYRTDYFFWLLDRPEETIVVDVGDWVPRKVAAVLCHRTQMGADNPFIRLDPADARRWLGTEQFRRLEPQTGCSLLEELGQPGLVS